MIRIGRHWFNPAFIAMVVPIPEGGCTIHFSKDSGLSAWTITWSASQVIEAFSKERRAEGYDQAVLEEAENAARGMS